MIVKGDNSIKDHEEELFFDGENYVTREQFFGSDDEEESDEATPQRHLKWIKRTIAGLLAIVLVMQIVAFWPQLYNLAAIKFLAKSRELSKNEAVQGYKQAVVEIKAGKSSGTGFSISELGYIVTNDHVIAGEETIYVSFPESKGHRAEIVTIRPDIDIAIIKIEKVPSSVQPTIEPAIEHITIPQLELKFEHELERGQPVYVIGNPLLFSFIANEGAIIGTIQLQDWDQPVLVFDAPIYKGNSGSPVITHDGDVIGVVFATTKLNIQGKNKKVGLAIPVDYFAEQVAELELQ